MNRFFSIKTAAVYSQASRNICGSYVSISSRKYKEESILLSVVGMIVHLRYFGHGLGRAQFRGKVNIT